MLCRVVALILLLLLLVDKVPSIFVVCIALLSPLQRASNHVLTSARAVDHTTEATTECSGRTLGEEMPKDQKPDAAALLSTREDKYESLAWDMFDEMVACAKEYARGHEDVLTEIGNEIRVKYAYKMGELSGHRDTLISQLKCVLHEKVTPIDEVGLTSTQANRDSVERAPSIEC